MPRIDLAVPFVEKDEAKRLGARWDGERKLWYVPDGVDAGTFGRWLPSEPDIGVRSSSYFIAQSTKPCWKCNEHTIILHEFAEPFGCNGSTAYGDHLFEYMRRA